ncbi:hypothetical protein, partial [Streptococcus dysgalactiae]|uniref:hypothetical protein n=1 Tax=Streptococcus dysgalactiae TaxID=1334 RepID=UPI001CF1BE40
LKVIISRPIVITIVKEKTSWINIPVCLQSELRIFFLAFFLSSYKRVTVSMKRDFSQNNEQNVAVFTNFLLQ